MARISMTYDNFQHATALQEERENARGKTVATYCPYTGKGEEFSPLELTGTGVAGCCLISMGTFAMRRKIDVSGTRLDVDLSWTKENDRIGKIELIFTMPRNYSAKERMMLERLQKRARSNIVFIPILRSRSTTIILNKLDQVCP